MAESIKQEVGKLVRFGLVGGGATFVHLGVAWTLLYFFQSWSPLVVNLIAFLVAFSFSYLGHRHFTFKSEGNVIKFFVIAFAGFALNNGLLAILLSVTDLPDYVALTITTLLVPLVSYFAARLWAFK
ncbi:GtrA family protein [Phytohalomonas tamaricis]|uniref:GtrA family protein n=1 Tax=Phytohalomonas tamaricis TaxID=2081032 RepID=UPI000D0BE313|nr:GtrA family protein [Phytohalomonas tamaricis]